MKKILYGTKIVAMAVMLFSSIAFISCDKDNPNSLIEGTWRNVEQYYGGGTEYYTFKRNGKYSHEIRGGEFPQPVESGYYTFDNGLLHVSATEHWIDMSYMVEFPDNDTLMLIYLDGGNRTFKRE